MLKQLLPLTLAALLCSGTGCQKKRAPVLKPGELTDAQRTELRQKALVNYKKLVEKYPDSPHAGEAKVRVDVLTAASAKK